MSRPAQQPQQPPQPQPPTGKPFSIARLAALSLGAATLVLIIFIPIILGVAQWSPIAGLITAFLAIAFMIATIAVISRRIVARAERDMLEHQAYLESLLRRPGNQQTSNHQTSNQQTGTERNDG